MACSASKVPFLRIVARRGYSVAACPRPVGELASVESEVLSSKLLVASAESQMPITRVSIVFRAGARNEQYETQGATHMLRIAAGLSTQNSSGFAITRNIQQIGGNLTVTSDREIVSYTVESTSDKVETVLRYLQDAIQPNFKPWELDDCVARIRSHVAAVPPQVRAVELLHKAAFRRGLGNSIYIPKHQIGKLSSESLLHYVASNFTAERCAVIGIGIDQNTLTGFANSLELPNGVKKSDSNTYYGGDARKDTPGNVSHVAIAGQGGALLNQREALSFAILQNAVGGGSVTKYGNNNGPWGKALASAIGDAPVSFSPLNANYADAGLFGFVVSSEAQNIGKAVDVLTKQLKSGAVSADDITRGKAVLKTAIYEAYSSDSQLIAELGLQGAVGREVQSADSLINCLEAVTNSDVQSAAKKVGSSPLSIGAVGNLSKVPYSSELA